MSTWNRQRDSFQKLLAASILILTLGNACGVTRVRTVLPSEKPRQDLASRMGARNFDDPLAFGHSEQRASIAAAESDVSFTILRPQFETAPKAVRVTDAGHEGAVLALIYDVDPYGRVVIIESLANEQHSRTNFTKMIDELVALNDTPSHSGMAESVTVRGERALLTRDIDGLFALELVVASVDITIEGPTLTRNQILEIAEGLS